MAGMTYDDLLEHYGSLTKAADALDLAKQTVHRWKAGEIPFRAQFIIQMKTNGKLKAKLPEELTRAA